jgi:DNA-binding NtrC family response regulator
MQAADICTAYTHLFAGDVVRAEQAFLAISTHPVTNSATQLGSLDGLVRVYLASGQLDNAERVITSVNERIGRTGWNYDVRFAPITKARLLINKGRHDEAIALLDFAKERFIGERDIRLTAAVYLIHAQAVARKGDARATGNRILRASELNVTAIKDLQAEYYYGCALTITDNAALAMCLRQRAIRLWASQGVVSVQRELDNALSIHAPPENTAVYSEAGPGIVDCVANSLAAMNDVAHRPRLLAEEMASVIRALECSPDVTIVESRGKDSPKVLDTTVSLPVGAEGKKNLWLVCTLPDTPTKATVLADVLRMGRAALELERARTEERNRAAVWPASPVEEQAGALFVAEEMQTLLATARRIAGTTVPVLITGETGTGKEVLARTIHASSNRAAATFLPFNCSSVPRDMLDSQLFGHRRGSFTGATENFTGVIRAASGGTLFLDEIGETTLEVQPKLLRFLDTNEVHPIGEVQPVRADVRVIAATNVDLDAFVAQGQFREDLFYRLNIVRLHVPPLRERRVEIPALANHYLLKHAHEYGKGDLRLAEETMEYLVLYRWPGNVRQLANEMRRMAALAETGAVLMPEHLSSPIAASRRTIPASERVLDPTELVVRLDQPVPAAVQHLERTMIQFAMRVCGGRMEDTARMLGLSRKGLYLKRLRYDLEPPEGASNAEVA